ncbi:MAG: hypothetical protein ACP5GS_08590, partial [Nitrososphaeria archaeon]
MEPAVETIIYAGLSAYTLNPLNVVVLKKKTSEGGTYTLLETLKIFPEEDIIKLDYATPTSFFHERIEGFVDKVTNEDITEKLENLRDEVKQLEKDVKRFKNDIVLAKELEEKKKALREMMNNAVGIINLWHKIIVFTEPPNSELFAKLKPLLSHDDIYVETAFTDKGQMGLSTIHVRIEGWPAVFTVFSEDEVNRAKQGVITDPQLFSRFLKIEINNRPEKFQSVVKFKGIIRAQPHVLNTNFTQQMEKAKAYIRYLRAVMLRMSGAIDPKNEEDRTLAINVFAPLIARNYKAMHGEAMRAMDYLLSLMEIRALLSYDYRLKVQDGKKLKVFASLEDVVDVLLKYGAQIFSFIPATKLAEYGTLKEVLGNGALSADDIFQSGKFNYSSPHSLRTHLLSILVKYGYLKTMIDPADPKHKRLLFVLTNETPELNLIAPFNRTDAGVRFGAIGAIAKQFYMKWIEPPRVLIAPKTPFFDSIKSSDNLTPDELFDSLILSKNALSGAITPQNMKQLIAPVAPDRTQRVV